MKEIMLVMGGAVAGVVVYRLLKTEEKCCSLVIESAKNAAAEKLGDLLA